MGKILVFVSFTLLFWGCDSNDSRSKYSQYISFNNTISHIFENVVETIPTPKEGNDNDLKQGRKLISSHLLSAFPPFVITTGNPQCNKESQIFLKHLQKMELWALKMYDSSGKVPSGLLNGNINQFGDFDECLSAENPNLGIKAKYCLAYLQIRPIRKDFDEKTFEAYKLMQSHFLFKSKLTDPGHRIPRFSTMNWGLCIPSSCTSADAEFQLRSIIERYSNGTGFDVEVKIEGEMCQQKETFQMTFSFFLVSGLLSLFIITSIVATLMDVFVIQENLHQINLWSILNCFSLKRNGKALICTTRSSDDIETVHGIRMANALMLLLAHKSMALFFMPYSNRTSMAEKLTQPWCIIARAASLYTDSFIMISGLLTSYSFVKTLKKNGRLDLKNEYISRLVRIVPPLAVIILLSTFIIPKLGSGPQWNLTVAHHADKCKKTWWRNFLFIHNYLGFENMCLTHTHHMGIDTQLFFISPFLVTILFKWPIYGMSALIGLAAASTMARFQTTYDKNLTFFIYPGITVGQMFDTANHSYIIPFHRLTAYIIGILLGYALRHFEKDSRIKPNFLRLGWTATLSFLSYILTKGNEMNHPGYVYNNRDAAVYAALAPIAWCVFVGWLIFVSHIGCGGVLNKIIGSKYGLIWTRISYAVYLTQFPIYFFNVGLQKYPQQFSHSLLVNVLEYGSIILASVALTLFFDMPFGNLKKLFIVK